MKRVVKIIIVLCFCFSVIVFGSLPASAYHPIVHVKSSDWVINTEYTKKAVYPEKADSNYAPNDKLYEYSYLDGDTYLSCRNELEYTVFKNVDVTIPSPYSNGSFELSNDDHFIIVRVADTFVLFGGCSLCEFDVYQGKLYQYCKGNGHTSFTTYSDYPYSYWYQDEALPYIVDAVSAVPQFDELLPLFDCGWYSFNTYDFNVHYCNIDLYYWDEYYPNVGLVGSDFRAADTSDCSSGIPCTITLEHPLYVNYGSVSFTLSNDDISRLSYGSHAWLFEDFGFIYGMSSAYTQFFYQVQISANGVTDKKSLCFFSHNSYVNDESLVVGKDYIFDNFQVTDFNFDLTQSDLDITFIFTFISDGFQLFFPGEIEIVEFESYEDDMEHDEVLNSIKDATTNIMNSIDNNGQIISSAIKESSDELSAEISGCINENFDKLLTTDEPAPDLSIDTSGIDTVVADEDKLLDDIYNTLDSKNQEYLLSLGYNSVDDFLSDNINDLNNSALTSSFNFVKSLFENVVSVTGVSTLVFFSLTFGFCIYLIGRRVS